MLDNGTRPYQALPERGRGEYRGAGTMTGGLADVSAETPRWLPRSGSGVPAVTLRWSRSQGIGQLRGALMRKLAKALFYVARGEPFDSTKLFDVQRLGMVA